MITHACSRFVEKQQARFLHQKHPNFQKLLLAVGEFASQTLCLWFEPNEAQRFLDVREGLFAESGGKRMEPAFILVHRKVEVLPNRMFFEDGRFLEFPADSRSCNPWFIKTSQVDSLTQENVPAIRFCLSGDNVHHRCFSCAVWTDDAAQFSIFDRERKLVERLEAIEAHGNIVQIKNDLMRKIDFTGNIEMR